MRQTLGIFCIVFVLSWVAGPLGAASNSGLRSLNGLPAVRVVVEDLNRSTQKTGLRKEQLYTIAVQRLLQDKIPVIKPQARVRVPFVYIRLSSVIGGEGTHAPVGFYLTVQVKQLAVLASERRVAAGAGDAVSGKPLLVTTWENGTMVLASRSEFFFYVQNILTNLLGDLVRDYQEANGAAA